MKLVMGHVKGWPYSGIKIIIIIKLIFLKFRNNFVESFYTWIFINFRILYTVF